MYRSTRRKIFWRVREEMSDRIDREKRPSSILDLDLASPSSVHFGQLVWAKLATAPFWPAVIFTEENQDWIRQKGRTHSVNVFNSLQSIIVGKSTYVHVFFFGETAERSWIQTTRILPFLGMNKFSQQKLQWRRKVTIISIERRSIDRS